MEVIRPEERRVVRSAGKAFGSDALRRHANCTAEMVIAIE
jgi:hypothetical protein